MVIPINTIILFWLKTALLLWKVKNDWKKSEQVSILGSKIGLAVSQKSRETWGKKSRFSRDSKSARL